jgi:hypothetical protein
MRREGSIRALLDRGAEHPCRFNGYRIEQQDRDAIIFEMAAKALDRMRD